MLLKGKTAFISGAGRNNGKAIALNFAREGADLVLIARKRSEDLNKVVKECESSAAQVLPLLADMSKPPEVERAVARALERFGKVDVLVNAIGLRPHKMPWEYGYEEWDHIFAVNCHSSFYLAKALAPHMIERKAGSIIVLGGNSALTASSPDSAVVAASKHAVHGLVKALAQALGPHGVRANLLALGHIENERLHPEWYAGSDNRSAAQNERTPLRREGRPSEVANVALFLASDLSSYVTGDFICCNGGRQL